MNYKFLKYISIKILRKPILIFEGMKLFFFEGILGLKRRIKLEQSKDASKNDRFQINNDVESNYFYNRTLNKQINYDTKKLPISVIITSIQSRNRFLNEFVLPSVKANNPAEIIIISDMNLNVQEKRNKGASTAKQPYLFFCDDDIILPKNHLKILYFYLNKRSDIGYVYTDYYSIVIDFINHYKKYNYYHKSKNFNADSLKNNNYISTMALIRSESFCAFDPKINRFQDWDLWLSLLRKGIKGQYIEDTGFFAFYLDNGITSQKDTIKEAKNIILRKHNIKT